MPSKVQQRVRNCAIASKTFAVKSWSARIRIDAIASITATANELAAMLFSNLLFMPTAQELCHYRRRAGGSFRSCPS